MRLPVSQKGRIARLAYGLAAVLAGLLCAAAVVSAAQAAAPTPRASSAPSRPASGVLTPVVGSALKHDVSAPLRALAARAASPAGPTSAQAVAGSRLLPNRAADPLYLAQLLAQGLDYRAVRDPVVQRAPLAGAGVMPPTLHNFEGISNRNGVLPADPNGDIGYDPATGQRYYMQSVNLSLAIWEVDATGAFTQVVAPTNGNALWSGFGGTCETENDGDPIVLFDPIAKRWLASQFAAPGSSNPPVGPFYQCIAVSVTANPTGAWYRYAFLVSSAKMNDYPKFGVWPDGYYMSINQFFGGTGLWAGAGAVVFERDKMLQGLPAQAVYFDLFGVDPAFQGQLPSDLDGPDLPPPGAPNYFVEVDDDIGSFGVFSDSLQLWQFHVDWVNPTSSTFGLGGQPNSVVPTADFSLLPCATTGSRNCIPQPGTTTKLDALGDRLMYRLAYRNFGDHEALVLNHTVSVMVDGQAGIRWYEVRDPGGSPTLFQQGTYAPDGLNRWMGSIAMDHSGDIALGYSVSSAGVFPSIRYAGRLAGDLTGTLPQAEGTLIDGGGAQTSTTSRWGDYSMLAVDPLDDCTFWYTNEYYPGTSVAGWHTRIGSFRFPSCSSAPVGRLTGVISDADTLLPLSGALVSVSPPQGLSTQSDGSGHYGFTLAEGFYTVTASATAHYAGIVTDVQVISGSVVAQDLLLVPWPNRLLLPVIYR